MDTAATDFEAGLGSSPEEQEANLRKQVDTLYQNLRTVRHAINNNVAVIMAMAELSQRNPAQSQRLSQICLEKAPQIAAAVGGFMEMFEGSVRVQEETRQA